jgi:hypothetical protein
MAQAVCDVGSERRRNTQAEEPACQRWNQRLAARRIEHHHRTRVDQARFHRSGARGLCRVQIMARLTGCPLVRRQHARHGWSYTEPPDRGLSVVRVWTRSSMVSSVTSSGLVSRWSWVSSKPP